MSAAKYNLVNKSNQITPNYDLSKKEITIVTYINLEMDLCIVGELDPNYIVWCSRTKLDDEEVNAEIFDYIANNKFEMYSKQYLVLGYDIMKSRGLCSRITRSTIPGRIWEVPYDRGLGYGTDVENHGKYFAYNVKAFYYETLDKCKFRICDGRYSDILENYYKLLTQNDDYRYYTEIKQLFHILEAENYLLLCPDEAIRELYKKCMKAGGELYNNYISVGR